MASFDDLGQALRDDAAANAPRASAIDVDAVTRAARARRRPRQWAVGTLSVVAVLGFGGLAVAAVAPPVLIAASESADLEAGAADSGAAPRADSGEDERLTGVDLADIVGCGVATGRLENEVSDLSLELRIATVSTTGPEAIYAVAELVNRGEDAVALLTDSTAIAVLTQNGVVVGAELPRDVAAVALDLAPGESYELPITISTLDCRGTATEPLAPGIYSVVAVLTVMSGPSALVVAEPVEIRLD